MKKVLAATSVVVVAGVGALIGQSLASAATGGAYDAYVNGRRAGVLTISGDSATFGDIHGTAGSDSDPITFPNGAVWRPKSGGWQQCHDRGWCGVSAYQNGQYVGDNYLSLQDTPGQASQEATFTDYARKLCPVAASKGFHTTDLADGATAPLDVNQSWPEGSSGGWTHLAEPAPCLSYFIDSVREPQRSNYLKVLQGIRTALAACANKGFKVDKARKDTFNPTYGYYDFERLTSISGSEGEGGSGWEACLSGEPWTHLNRTKAEFQRNEAAGLLSTDPAPGSVIYSITFCLDDRTTGIPDYVNPKTSLLAKWRDSRAFEIRSHNDTALFDQLRATSASIREALGVGNGAGTSGSIPGQPGTADSGLQSANPLSVGDLEAALA